ncbi:hypothetical protein HDU97_008636 [Phlyctochytrium planicorne]|nr:hypothetical protein HDU97_008636 [Phlyctochytrium planicorne]
MSSVLNLNLRLPSGEKRTIVANSEDTLQTLKEKVAAVASITPADSVRLIDRGRVLKGEENTLATLEVKEGATLYVSKVSVDRAAAFISAPIPPPSQSAGGFMPEGAREMLNNPMISALLENPDFIQAMLQADPRFAQMQESHPEITQMLNDRSFLQQMSSAIRNPAVMQEMMRNHDRSLSNIESYPGGMAALSSMYNSLQQENDALTDRPVTTEDSNRAFAERLGATATTERLNQSALPNPWARPAAAVAATSTRGNQAATPAPTPTSATTPFPPVPATSPFGSMFPFPSFPFAAPNTTATANNYNNPLQPNPFQSGTGSAQDLNSILAQLQDLQAIQNSLAAFDPYGSATPSFTAPSAGPPAATSPAATSTDSMEETYKDQLTSMQEMGFTDKAKNLKALMAAGGNTESAIIYLIESLDGTN